ncbi:iron-siderophore ABC transporter substrate-binding protein [Chitinibacter bivalviorum]|uniref:Iron-siderophore ABC transporter substrate-binding protein n=1 Tax=Chitinibacter bivalviorum TaxID=2739434 RepID=A0A7H9BFU5_9NEIS|nr:iron-siderophore ABC transporter substrate-binding protein [Chitinibacter bivalviorum]QLG87583.1 iron-siderophore ABC transporter substrate-binding protein [Chitinibacter bivalviorum]
MINRFILVVACLLACTAQAGPKVIALSWESTEYLLNIGVTPQAIADRVDYDKWVVQPALPAHVLDVGSRFEPNLERIYALKPDLILIGPALSGMQSKLLKIAPTIVLDAFRTDHDNALVAEQLQRQLAIRLNRLPAHEAFLEASRRKQAELRQSIAQRFGSQPPAVCVVRFASPTTYWAYGENSMPEAALNQLGLRNACPQARSMWGLQLHKVPDLSVIGDGVLLKIMPFEREAELMRSPIWQALPVVRRDRVYTLPPVWTHGGLHSIDLLAQSIADTLTSSRN